MKIKVGSLVLVSDRWGSLWAIAEVAEITKPPPGGVFGQRYAYVNILYQRPVEGCLYASRFGTYIRDLESITEEDAVKMMLVGRNEKR